MVLIFWLLGLVTRGGAGRMGVSSALFPTVQDCAPWEGYYLQSAGEGCDFPGRKARPPSTGSGGVSPPRGEKPFVGAPALVHRATCLAVDLGDTSAFTRIYVVFAA